MGKHKVAPLISPNKMWEGLIGGVLSAALVMLAIKRDVGIKDYGNLISGHGGVMDRIDSLIYAGPIFLYLALRN